MDLNRLLQHVSLSPEPRNLLDFKQLNLRPTTRDLCALPPPGWIHQVRNSDVLVLFQTEGVLLRPYCILGASLLSVRYHATRCLTCC